MTKLAWFFGPRGQGGQAVVLLAILFLAMLMAVGLAIDAGQLFVARRTMQEATDSAAFAGSVVLYQNGTTVDAEAAARADATQNGYTQGVNGTSVIFRRPPASGPYTGNVQFVEVEISQPVRTSLVPGQSLLTTVTTRGVAGATPVASGWAIIATERTNAGGINWGSSGNLTVSGAGMFIDSSHSVAANHGGAGTIAFVGGSYTTAVVGGVQGAFPNAVTGQSAIPDPYAGTPKPDTAGLPTFTTLPPGGLVPGIYEGVDIDTPRTLAPGMYILKNSSIHAGVTGTGVTIWLASSSFPANGTNCGEIHIPGPLLLDPQVITLSAPTTGPYAGFTIVQEPLCTRPLHLREGLNFDISGTVYIPGADFDISSNGTTTKMNQLVAKRVNASSNATLTVNYTAGTTAKGLVPALSE